MTTQKKTKAVDQAQLDKILAEISVPKSDADLAETYQMMTEAMSVGTLIPNQFFLEKVVNIASKYSHDKKSESIDASINFINQIFETQGMDEGLSLLNHGMMSHYSNGIVFYKGMKELKELLTKYPEMAFDEKLTEGILKTDMPNGYYDYNINKKVMKKELTLSEAFDRSFCGNEAFFKKKIEKLRAEIIEQVTDIRRNDFQKTLNISAQPPSNPVPKATQKPRPPIKRKRLILNRPTKK